MKRVCAIVAIAACLAACGTPKGEGDARRILNRATNNIASILTQAEAILREVAMEAEVRDHDVAACNAKMAARAKAFTVFGSIGVTDAKGSLWCLSIPFTPPVNVVDRAYFKMATGSGGFVVGDFQVGRVTGAETVIAAFPVVQAGNPAPGVLLLSIPLTNLTASLKAAVPLPEGADLIVTDGHGTVVARLPSTSSVAANLSGTALIKAMLTRSSGSGDFILGGVQRRYVYTVASAARDLRIAAGVRLS